MQHGLGEIENRTSPRSHQKCTNHDSQGQCSGVLIMCVCSQDAARELGEGAFVLVQGMGVADTLGQMHAHELTMSMMSRMSTMPQLSIARDTDLSSSQAWHSVSLFY